MRSAFLMNQESGFPNDVMGLTEQPGDTPNENIYGEHREDGNRSNGLIKSSSSSSIIIDSRKDEDGLSESSDPFLNTTVSNPQQAQPPPSAQTAPGPVGSQSVHRYLDLSTRRVAQPWQTLVDDDPDGVKRQREVLQHLILTEDERRTLIRFQKDLLVQADPTVAIVDAIFDHLLSRQEAYRLVRSAEIMRCSGLDAAHRYLEDGIQPASFHVHPAAVVHQNPRGEWRARGRGRGRGKHVASFLA